MQYRVTAHVIVEKKGELVTKVIKLDSETPLTVQQVKDQCFVKLELATDRYTKKSEEVWQRGVRLKESNLDTYLLDREYQANPDYYLTVSPV